MRNPFAAFKDPERRPRAWIWGGAIVIAVMAFYAVAQMATSTQWFCEEPCHNVHADNTRAFDTSSHSQISCIACHYKVEMNPISFALDRADKLIDIPPTIFGTFEMPMNRYSHMAFVMESTQCTQCHKIATTPFPPPEWQAVTFDQKTHDQHARQGIACTICHNRDDEGLFPLSLAYRDVSEQGHDRRRGSQLRGPRSVHRVPQPFVQPLASES
jgi:hypothetical protein